MLRGSKPNPLSGRLVSYGGRTGGTGTGRLEHLQELQPFVARVDEVRVGVLGRQVVSRVHQDNPTDPNTPGSPTGPMGDGRPQTGGMEVLRRLQGLYPGKTEVLEGPVCEVGTPRPTWTLGVASLYIRLPSGTFPETGPPTRPTSPGSPT